MSLTQPHYQPCAVCGTTTIGRTSWLKMPRHARDRLEAQGILPRRHGRCRPCDWYAVRHAEALAAPYATVKYDRDDVLHEWRHYADPNLSIAENCRRIAPLIGMRWRSLERAITRARAREQEDVA